MWFKHSMSIAQQLIPIYNTTVHKNKSTFAFNVDTCWCYETPTCHKGGTCSSIFTQFIHLVLYINYNSLFIHSSSSLVVHSHSCFYLFTMYKFHIQGKIIIQTCNFYTCNFLNVFVFCFFQS